MLLCMLSPPSSVIVEDEEYAEYEEESEEHGEYDLEQSQVNTDHVRYEEVD